MNRIAGRSGMILLFVLALLAGFTFFLCEYVGNSAEWAVFPGSPHVYNGNNIGCGVVTDREGVLLLDLNDGRRYASIERLREATVHWLGDRSGSVSAPSLSNYVPQMSGYDLLNGVYSYGGQSGVASLTLSAHAQTAALEALGNFRGTVGVYNYKTGELLCAVTTPTFDPDNVPNTDSEAYEGIFVNRFTQSSYIPGSIFKIVTLAAALEEIPDIQDQKFVCRGSYEMDGGEVSCEGAHWEQTLKMAFRNSCNCAFAQISEQLGKDKLFAYLEQFGVLEPVSFDGITTAAGNVELDNAAAVSVAWSSIGQYKDLINPCAFMTFVGAVASEGKGSIPYLVSEITVDGSRTYRAREASGKRIMSANTSRVLAEYMAFNVSDKYGSENFPGMTVCAKTGTGEVGGGKKPNAMLAGFVADEDCPLAFIIAVEDGGYGAEVCIPIASKVLAACKDSLNP